MKKFKPTFERAGLAESKAEGQLITLKSSTLSN
jgi:hypothetical protein